MKLASKSQYLYCTYKINLEELISPIYYLIFELSDKKSEGDFFCERSKTLFDVTRIIDKKEIPDTMTEDSFLMNVVSFIENELYATKNYLEQTEVCMIYRDKGILIAKGKEKEVKSMLSSWLKFFNPVKCLLELLVSDKLIKLNDKICSLVNDATYNMVVSINNSEILASTIIPKKWMKLSDLSESPIDPDSIWICRQLSTIVGEISHIDLKIISEFQDNNCIGVCLGDYLISFSNIDNKIVDENYADYFWEMLQNVYSQKKPIKSDDNRLKPFIDACKESEFCKILSYLKYNLYIAKGDISIPSKYLPLFEEVYNIEDTSHVPNYSFYTGISNEEQIANKQTLLGVYKLEKSSDDYNLLNWINIKKEDKHQVTTCNNCIEQKLNKVYALLPQYSYYFMSKFFEESFSCILKELKCNYITNVSLSIQAQKESFIEIDSIVKKKNGNFIYIENKTTLNKFNVEDTIAKIINFQMFMSQAYPKIAFEYVIISPFCDMTIEDSFLYFIKNGGKAEERDGILHKIYDFSIPLAKFGSISLRCIVEPEYAKMKEKVDSLLQ